MTNREIQALNHISFETETQFFNLDCEGKVSEEFGKAIDDIRKIIADAIEAEKKRRQEAAK